MENRNTWQRLLFIPIGIVAVALLLYNFDPLMIAIQKEPAETVQRENRFNPYYVKGFKKLDGQYFIVIQDGVQPKDCPCSDLKVRRGKNPRCPVVHHREKKAIIDEGRKLGLPEHNFPVLEVCD